MDPFIEYRRSQKRGTNRLIPVVVGPWR